MEKRCLESKIVKYDEKVTLTLKYYLKQRIPALQEGYVTEAEGPGPIDAEELNNHCSDHWWRGMKNDYKAIGIRQSSEGIEC